MLNHFFQLSSIPKDQIIGWFNINLVILSYIVALFSSYIALDITGHLRDFTNSKRVLRWWLLGGAFAMGAGIWSMHFVGMLAFSLPGMAMNTYDSFWTLLSLIVAILASGFAFTLLKTPIIKLRQLMVGGIVLGLAIACMHYTGMEAMRLHVNIHYLPGLFFLSMVIAIIASEAALWLAIRSNTGPIKTQFKLKLISAFIMGAAICGMHYTGMAAAIFTPITHSHHKFPIIDPTMMAISVAALTFVIMLIAFFLSRTKRLSQTNDELVEATSFLKNILQSSIEYSIIALDLNKMILTWNAGAERNYGYKAHEMIRKENVFKLHPGLEKLYEQAYLEGKASGEYERLLKNGQTSLTYITVTLRKDSKNKPIGYLVISKDIAEQKKLEAQKIIIRELEAQNKEIFEANRLKNEFLANMSHELRTPLNSILGFSELMSSGDMGSVTKEQQEALQDITLNGKHLLRIVSDILDFARIEAGKLVINIQEVDLRVLVQEVLKNLFGSFTEKQITHHFSIDDAVAIVKIDPVRFKQILYNLLSNAIKFTPDQGVVKISIAGQKPGYFDLVVADNGIGIAPEDLDRIFGRFTQIDSGMSKRYPGTGLGLTLTKQLVEALGGRIKVESVLHKGSVFTVTFPI